MGAKCKCTNPLLRKNHLQPLVVLGDDLMLVLNQDIALCNLTFTVADPIMDIFYFLVQLTECFLESCQPAVGMSCIQNNLGDIVLNLGKMQLLGISTDRKQITVTNSTSLICNTQLSELQLQTGKPE